MKKKASRSSTEARFARPAGTQSIQRAVNVLREIATNGDEGLRVVDIANRLGLEPPTAHRIVKSLLAEGLLMQRQNSRRYHLGHTVYELGLSASSHFRLRELFHPTLAELAEQTMDVVFLVVRSHLDVVCIDRVEGSYPIKTLTLDVGGRRPLGVGAGSLVLLASLPPAERDAVIAANSRRLLKYGRMTPDLVRSALKTVEELGYALNEDLVIEGVTAIGVGIRAPAGEVVAAVSISSISSRMMGERREKIIAMLRRAARVLERALNGEP